MDSHALADTVAEEQGERLSPGTLAGEYRIEEHVGAGAMGDVYRAVHPVIGKRVAIKVIKRKLTSSAEAIERFVREAQAANRVDHPNVIDVFAMGRLADPDGRLWLAMDLLEGESLGKRLRREGAMTPAQTVAVLRPVCDALDAAHARRVVHRDLKTDNIFLAPAGRVMVLDFGIAKVLADVTGHGARPELTSQGSWIGTPAYMAPEQWTSEGASAASDIYSLGIVAYEMLCGRPPFSASSLPALMEQHFRADAPRLPGVSAAVDAAVRRALAKKPSERPATAGAFLHELEQAARSGRRRPTWALAAAAGVLVVGLAALFVITRGAKAKPAIEECVVSIASRPTGAEARLGDRVLGTTPVILHAKNGETVQLSLSRPGWATKIASIQVRPDASVELALEPVRGFEGVWRIPGGSLRAFERPADAEQVRAYTLDAPEAPKRFVRSFTFVPDEGARVGFSALEESTDARAPAEPSCHFTLGAEYRYTPATDMLELRRQLEEYTFDGHKCRMTRAPQWTAYEPAQRLAQAETLTRIESQGTTGQVQVVAPNEVNAISPPANPPIQAKDVKKSVPPPIQQKKKVKPIPNQDQQQQQAAPQQKGL